MKYACRVCERVYKTEAEARECYKHPATKFKYGDLVWDGNTPVYRIDRPFSGNDFGACVTRVREYDMAQGYSYTKSRDNMDKCYLIGAFWCRARKFTVADARLLLAQAKQSLSKRIEAAERLVKLAEESEVKAS